MNQPFDFNFKLNRATRVYSLGKFSFWLLDISWKRFDGKGFNRLKNAVVFHRETDSVAVIVYRPEDKKICLVEQFRPATLLAGKGGFASIGGGLLEIPAGSVNEGEELIDAAIREVSEEVGVYFHKPILITTCYPAPGTVSEKISIFKAVFDGFIGDGGGLRDEQEDILVHWVDIKEAREMIRRGVIKDAKTIIAIQDLLLELS